MSLRDPSFALNIAFNVDKAYQFSKDNNVSFFAKYLHDCMKAINETDNLKYRVIDGNIVEFDVIHASATIMREDNTYGFSFIKFDKDLNTFMFNIENEKRRINSNKELFPPVNGQDCIHCSAIPWFSYTSHKEPVSGTMDCIPKISFGKMQHGKMNVNITANHALVDGYHIGVFAEKFQNYLNN